MEAVVQLTRALLAIDPVSAALMPSGAPAGRPAAVVLAQLLLAVPFHLPATPLTVPYARGTAARSLSGGAQALMVAATAAALLAGAALWRLDWEPDAIELGEVDVSREE